MFERNKSLLLVSACTLLFFLLYSGFVDNSYFSIGHSKFPAVSEEEAIERVIDFSADNLDLGLDKDYLSAELFINHESEHFLAANDDAKMNDEHFDLPPISMWKVSYSTYVGDSEDDKKIMTADYFVDLDTGKIIGFFNPDLVTDAHDFGLSGLDTAEAWLADQGLTERLSYVRDEQTDKGIAIHHFLSNEPLVGDRALLYKVFTYNGNFTGYYPKLDVPEPYTVSLTEKNLTFLLNAGSTLLYMTLIFVLGLIMLVLKATEQRLSFTFPLLIGLSVVVLSILFMTNLIGVIEGLLSGAIVFFALVTVYEKRDRLWNRIPARINRIREQVLQGYLLAIVLFLPSFIFYTVGNHLFDIWSSSEDTFLMLKDAKWLWLTPFLIGITAAISEEIMYRKFGEFVVRRVWNNQLFIALTTSFIWAIAHLGYNVHPWYLRVIELTFFVGPVLYFVYKKYGLLVSMIAHYLFNCLIGSLTLMSFSRDYASTLLLLLVPLLLCFIPAKRDTPAAYPATPLDGGSI
ncbi:type II CAAX endopeptidase family protein [Numidum massiliense]|uniref:type II CAAX endopeptidase family protein n=1 Tax=Numidum massiliense TaxID=1522315 RepID=UPI0006D53FEB|nr:type II CAAX endopeptidase family protein [Numidum massiliense]